MLKYNSLVTRWFFANYIYFNFRILDTTFSILKQISDPSEEFSI